ncbi:AAA family ATPase [Fimbriiglobus ruber]|nr:ATP-binding protein [Fimbriiglobus ruber]
MIRQVRIENFKSIPDLVLDLGRVTVLIGANGSGKSNILEAIATASAAAQNKLDNEFLSSRGIRTTEMQFMLSAFERSRLPIDNIGITIRRDNDIAFSCTVWADKTASYLKWKHRNTLPFLVKEIEEIVARLRDAGRSPEATFTPEFLNQLLTEKFVTLPGFLVYAPENSALRTFLAEGQILPLGIRGEGLFAHLKGLGSEKYIARMKRIKERLSLIDWFEEFEIPKDLGQGERSIRIRDRFLPDGTFFDQRSANEGFLFLLFYMTLFISPDTPAFFAIDNIDSSLNPKLCIALIQQIAILAKEYDKQVILATHNPAILDGLDLHDDEQRLLVVERNKSGHTRVHRVEAPKQVTGQSPVSLSEAFMRGYIGGLPKNF